MDNLYSNGGFYWWVGVVEDRMDPLLLGRCRVRVVGYHTADRSVLPTEDLPWAYPLGSINSGSVSGIGVSPVGMVEGTWVIGFFQDGTDSQEPVIIGTLGGIPTAQGPNIQKQSGTATEGFLGFPDGSVMVDGSGNPIPSEDTRTQTPAIVEGEIGPLTKRDLDKLFFALRDRESSGKYTVINKLGFVGAYQFGATRLLDMGYITPNALKKHSEIPPDELEDYALKSVEKGLITEAFYDTIPTNSRRRFNYFVLSDDTLWTSKAKHSASGFISSTTIQDRAVYDSFRANYRTLIRRNIIYADSPKSEVAGYLFVAHLLGVGGAVRYSKGSVGVDAFGASGQEYYSLGYRVVQTSASVDDPALVMKQAENIPEPAPPNPALHHSPETNESLLHSLTNVGFSDPNKVYPRSNHLNEPDTNRLARHQKIAHTVVKSKDDEREQRVETAREGPSWDQPTSPYNAKYPFNKVIETESGHVIEIDDTPLNERIHIYHTSGTFVEIDRNGTMVRKVVGDAYDLLERNGNVVIRGKANVTIEGECRVLIKNDCHLQVDGHLKADVHRDMDLNVAGDINVTAGGRFHVRAGDDIRLQGESVNVRGNLRADSGLAVKGGGITAPSVTTPALRVNTITDPPTTPPAAVAAFILATNQQVSSAPSASTPDVSAPVDRKNPKTPRFPELIVPSRSEELAFTIDALSEHEDENRTEIDAVIVGAIEDGILTEEELKAQPEATRRDDAPAPEKPFIIPGCGDVYGVENPPSTFRLSPNFVLSDLSSGAAVSKYSVQSQHGLSKSDIICNLKGLAEQVLEPIKAKYPNMLVTSGFRTPGHSKAVGISQHEKGMAVDIQFPGNKDTDYYDIARWIKNNVPYDQMLLEYKTFGTRLPWIHLSFNRDGNRNVCSTFLNDRTAPNGRGALLQLA